MPQDSLTFTTQNEVPNLEDAREGVSKNWVASETKKNGMDISESEAMRFLHQRIENEMSPAQADFHKEWDDAKEIYEAYARPEPDRPNLKAPLSHMVIDAAMAEEIDAFADIEIDTQEDDDKAKLPVLNAAKKYALSTAEWDAVKIDARRICRIYGFCPVRISYVREVRKIKDRYPVKSEDGGWMIQYKEKWDYPYDDVRFEVIDNPRRFLIDNRARDIRFAGDCALRSRVSWNVFKQRVQHNRYYSNLEFVTPGVVNGEDTGVAISPDQGAHLTDSDDVELLEYWNKDLDLYIVWANDIIIRLTPLPDDHKELPFAVLHLYRRPHSFYSKGIPKLIESVEAAYNKILNATIQACGLSFPIITTSEDAGIDPRSIASYPGIVLEGALDKMKLEQLGSIPAEVFKTKEELEKLLVWITGVNYQQIFGELSDRVGIEALKKESMLARVNANLRENESTFVVRLGNLLIQNIEQYYPAKKIRALMSTEDISKIPEEDKVYAPDGSIRAILETRKIPVKGLIRFDEGKSEDGSKYTLTPMISEKEGSFIMARPEYIRCRGKLDVRAIRPSAMGSSREAKKLMIAELISTALDVNAAQAQQSAGTNPQGQPIPGKPVWNIEFLSRTLAEAMELPVDKAIMSGDEDKGREAQKAIEELGSKMNASFGQSLDYQVEQQRGIKPYAEPMQGTAQAMPNDPTAGASQQNPNALSPQQQGDFASQIG